MPVIQRPRPRDPALFAANLPIPEWLKPKAGGFLELLAGLTGTETVTNPVEPDVSMMGPAAPLAAVSGRAAGGLLGWLARRRRPIRAYHGSPHDFQAEPGAPLGRFRSEAIGTGEGAQAYGHGLYFAERPQVAQGYKGLHAVKVRARVGETATETWERQSELIDLELDRSVLHANRKPVPPELDRRISVLMDDPVPGKTYEVDIHADPRSFLNWDKTLGRQSKGVRDLASEWYTQNPHMVRRMQVPRWDKISGMQLYTGIQKAHVKSQFIWNPMETPGIVSGAFAKAGVPGIRYLDQGSRAAGKGTYNYVVFDASKIEILRKYGLAAMVGAGLINQSLADQIAAGEVEVKEGGPRSGDPLTDALLNRAQ